MSEIVVNNNKMVGPITINRVSEDERLNFLPTYFQNDFMKVESSLFDIAENIISGYSGGYWEYAKIRTNVGIDKPFFFIEGDNNVITLSNPFYGDSVDVDSILAGLIVSIYTYNLVATNLCYEYSSWLTSIAYD